MAETDILQKFNQAFTALSQERKSIVVPLAEMIQKVGWALNAIGSIREYLP